MKGDIDYMTKKVSGEINKKIGTKLWLITEITQTIFVVMGAIMLLWLYAPFSTTIKFLLTGISLIIFYDIFRTFVHVKWILHERE